MSIFTEKEKKVFETIYTGRGPRKIAYRLKDNKLFGYIYACKKDCTDATFFYRKVPDGYCQVIPDSAPAKRKFIIDLMFISAKDSRIRKSEQSVFRIYDMIVCRSGVSLLSIIDMIISGKTQRQIAKELNKSRHDIFTICKRYKIREAIENAKHS